MRRTLLAAALLACLAGCQQAESPNATADGATRAEAVDPQADARFAELAQRALETWLRLSPTFATSVGDHRYDGELDDLSAEGRQRALEARKQLLAELDAIDVSRLSRENQVDAAILRADAERLAQSAEPDSTPAFRLWRAAWLAAWLERAPAFRPLAARAPCPTHASDL